GVALMGREKTDEWSGQELAGLYGDLRGVLGRLHDKELVERVMAYTAEQMRARQSARAGRLRLWTADEILQHDWPEPTWAVPDIIPAGLTILAGRPKVGKSWLALSIAQAVAAGGVVLGKQVEPGPVLYMGLEDNPRRLQSRMQQQGWPLGLAARFLAIGEFQE